MPLFTVSNLGRKSRVLVRAETVQELIKKSKAKLNLSEDVYKVALDQDGTIVDEDEILSAIAELSGNTTLKLILLNQDEAWQPAVDPVKLANIQKEDKKQTPSADHDTRTPDTENPRQSSSDTQKLVIGASLWAKFPPRLVTNCESGKIAYDTDRRTLAQIIAEHMIYEMNDFSRKTAERFAKIITEKYPATFVDKIGDKIIGNGFETLRQQIYTAAQYRRKNKELKRKAEMYLNDDDDDDTAECSNQKPKMQDEYGCFEYQPILPDTESSTSQNVKKRLLIDFCDKGEDDISKILKLMDETYPTQRSDINHKKYVLEQILKDWPYLFQQQHLINHASRLLNKSVNDVWQTALSTIAKAIRGYIAFTERTKVIKLKKVKESSADETPPKNVILELLSEAKKASKATKSEVPMIAVIFPIVAKYLKENPDLLYMVISEGVDFEKITEYAKDRYPILIIRGKSLFDEHAKCDVVMEQTVIVSARGVLDGFLITFIAYYVFCYMYKEGLTKTLEFIQRALLEINPPKGHKRRDKKRKATPCDAAVMKLSKAFAAFKEDEN